MAALPSISVIVPAHDAGSLLPVVLPTILAGYPAGAEWELIVVDDGSTDTTSDLAARYADRVVRLDPPARGPAAARNAGAAVARGDWLLFVDADIRLHPDTLALLVRSMEKHAGVAAIFGSYDADPAGPGMVSQFRNLLHHRVHSGSAGPAETFWAGLGVMRKDDFLAAGGFDAVRFPRPQIEDIELGYRLRDRGGRIVLDPGIQGTHLKAWNFLSMIRADFLDRGIPWTRLLLERKGRSRGTLAAGGLEPLRMATAGIFAVLLAAWLLSGRNDARIGFLAVAAIHLALCLPLYVWFGRRRGVFFSLASIPLLLVFYLTSAAAAAAGLIAYAGHRLFGGE